MAKLLKIYPIAFGVHNNTHYKVCTDLNIISMKVVVFNITSTAYILSARTKLHPAYLNEDFLLTDLKMKLLDRGIDLQDTHINWDIAYTTTQIIELNNLTDVI